MWQKKILGKLVVAFVDFRWKILRAAETRREHDTDTSSPFKVDMANLLTNRNIYT